MSVTVLILILSLFHQNAITSSAAFTTTSSLYNMSCPQGSQLFVPSVTFHYKFSSVHNNMSFVQHAVPSGLATILFQDPLQLFVPSGLASLQSSRDRLSLFQLPCNFPCPQGSQASRVSETGFPFSSFRATHRALSSHKLPDFITRPSELERTNYFLLIFWPELQMKIPSIRELPRPMHLKISGILNPYFSCSKFLKSFLIVS